MDIPLPVCPENQLPVEERHSPPQVESSAARIGHDFKDQPAAPAGVVFQSAMYAPKGFVAETREVALLLSRRGLPVCLAPWDAPHDSNPGVARDPQSALEQLTHVKLNLARSVLYYAFEPTRWNLDYHGQARVGRAAHWSDRLPRAWVEPCNAVDEIWVPGEFQRQAFAASGVDTQRLQVLRAGLDTQLFRPGLPALEIPHRRGFNFLTLTDFQDRKATELLLTAFLQEFQGDDVSLILKTLPRPESPVDLAAELAWFLEKTACVSLEKSPTLILLEELLPAADMPALYAAADGFVSSSRGESSARSLLEALACELPVVATAWGSALEFLDRENSFLVESEGLAAVSTGDEFVFGHRWASPSLEHLRQQMRAVYAHRGEARTRARRGRQKVVCEWDWSVVLPCWEGAFQRVLG